MALIVADRVQETTTTTGTGTYTLAGAKDGFQSFAAVGDGNTCYYAITDGTDWETGIGTFTLSGTTLARTTIIESSNSDAAVNWGAGSKDIFVTLPASKATVLDASGNATFTGDVTFEGATSGRNIVFDRSDNALEFVNDYVKAKFGSGSQMELYYSVSEGANIRAIVGSTGYPLSLWGSDVRIKDQNGNTIFRSDGASAELYEDGSKKLETTSAGIQTTGTVNVNGAYTLPTSDGTNGQVLTTDGAGAVTFADAGGGASAYTIENKTAAYTVVSGDLGKIINCSSGTFTISLTSAATLGAGWYCWIYNTDDGASNFAVTIDPDGSETIGFKSTIVLRQLEGVKIVSDGTNWLVGDDRKSLFFQQNYRAGFFTPSSATGLLSTAIGRGATSSAGDSFAAGSGAAGSGAKAAGNGSVVLGNAYSSGSDGFAAAISNNTSSYGATGTNSVAIGYQTKATNLGGVAIGYTAQATALVAVAIGNGAIASSRSGIAINEGATASADSAVCLGEDSTTSGANGSIIGGYLNTASGNRSAILGGYSNSATVDYSIAMGSQAKSDKYGKIAHATGAFANAGDAQGAIYVLRASTTDATPKVLATIDGQADANTQIVAASDTCIMFSGTIVAMQNGAQDQGGWEIKGLLKNDGGTTTLVSSNIQTFADGNGWTVALSADNTNNALAITCTGEAAHNIRWVANISTSEVTYA